MVSADQINWYQSSNGNLGGARTGSALDDPAINTIFDRVKGIELREGDVNYRCLYARNDSTQSDDPLLDPKIYISTPTNGSDGYGSRQYRHRYRG